MCRLDEWSDLVTALLSEPLSSDKAMGDILANRWKVPGQEKLEISYVAIPCLHTISSYSLNKLQLRCYIELCTIQVNVTIFVPYSIPSSSGNYRTPPSLNFQIRHSNHQAPTREPCNFPSRYPYHPLQSPGNTAFCHTKGPAPFERYYRANVKHPTRGPRSNNPTPLSLLSSTPSPIPQNYCRGSSKSRGRYPDHPFRPRFTFLDPEIPSRLCGFADF